MKRLALLVEDWIQVKYRGSSRSGGALQYGVDLHMLVHDVVSICLVGKIF